MKLMTSWRARRAPFDCARWASCSPTADPGEHLGVHDVYDVSLVAEASVDTILSCATSILLRYAIFPESRMQHHICTDDETIRGGALIVQRLIAGPMAIEAAVRVVQVFDARGEGGRAGFTYVTLEGHIERGAATFSVGVDESGAPTFRIESWSRPGNAFATIAHPLVRPMQRSSVHEALRHVRREVAASARAFGSADATTHRPVDAPGG